MIDIVIDLETLGTRPGCVILELGACAVDPNTGAVKGNFSRRLDEVYARFDEWVCDPDAQDTLRWWMGKERRETYQKLTGRYVNSAYSERDPRVQLQAFCDWFAAMTGGHDPETVRVWANGPAFDIAILCASFRRYGIKRPWICWQERCVRTALELAGYEKGGVAWAEGGPRHRALNDARHEARKLYLSGALGEVSALARQLRMRGNLRVEVRP